jgi:7-cyano-7-deazaguanine synthase
MDSTALAWWKRPNVAYTIDYGQLSAAGEIRAATAVAAAVEATHIIIRVDCSTLGSGDLAGSPPLVIAPVPEWWPFRNQLLLTLAGMRSVADGIDTLLVASVRTDGQHRDGTAEFFTAADNLMSIQEGGLRVEAPAISLTSAELIRRSGIPREVLAWAHSCHTDEYACGTCRGCNKHTSTTEELWGEGY